MEKGQKLKYIGTGFIGFHPSYTDMEFIKNDGDHDLWVSYQSDMGRIPKMLVRTYEVEEISNN
tara:strand:- start:243 stop:431 length:189 start_codon:yes stop_codon:yes gene_type:complete